MKKKILLALLIVVILIGAGVVYSYFATDAFKTNKDIFFSYILNDDMFKNLEDEKLAEYIKKQEDTAYTNKGEISVNAKVNQNDYLKSLDDTSSNIQMLNNSKITFEGKTDNNKKSAEQTVTVDLSMGVNIPFKIKRDGDTFGMQSNLLNSKYIAIRNENLKELCKRFDIEADEIPDKIELSKEKFTDEELKTLKKKYISILDENLDEDLFSKEKVDNETVITLKMTDEKCIEILTKILETLRNDEILLNKLPTGINKEDIQKQIDEMIEEIKKADKNENETVEVKINTKSKKLKKIEIAIIENDTKTMSTVLENNENQLTIKNYEDGNLTAELDITKETNGNDLTYTIKMLVDDSEKGKAEVSLKMDYKNLQALDNVEENYEAKISYEEDTEISLNFKNEKTFSQNLEIDGLNTDNATILNDATDDEIQNLLLQIYQSLGLME